MGVARSWNDLPIDRPISIVGSSANVIAISIESLPADAPAIITYRPEAATRALRVVDDLLGRLDQIARELFPAWLPAAAPIDGAAGAGAAAVRSIALRAARSSGQFGPFLADLAERSLQPTARARPRFSLETRAAGLARV